MDKFSLLNSKNDNSDIIVSRKFTSSLLSEGITLGSIILLWWCDKKSYNTPAPKYFLERYSINTINEFERLINKGFLGWSTPKDHISTLGKDELKYILKNKSLSTTGQKKILVERIQKNISDETLSQYILKKTYKVTESGTKLLKKYSNIIWGHKNQSNDGLIDAFTFKDKLTNSPTEYALEILQDAFSDDIKSGDLMYAALRLRNISIYLDGDLDSLLDSFCFQISGIIYTKDYLCWNEEEYPYISKDIKNEIIRNTLSELDVENRFKQSWERCYKLFPMSIVNNESDALDLLFLSINDDKKSFTLLMHKLYKKSLDEFKYNSEY